MAGKETPGVLGDFVSKILVGIIFFATGNWGNDSFFLCFICFFKLSGSTTSWQFGT